mgnify:CR=1 FL=1
MVDHTSNAKLIDSYFINGGKVNYELVIENPSSMSLLSPEQLESMREKKFITIENIHQSEMWQIGLSLLESMTAEPAMECYDLSTLTLKKGYFDKKKR